jgi:hypothetical protein
MWHISIASLSHCASNFFTHTSSLLRHSLSLSHCSLNLIFSFSLFDFFSSFPLTDNLSLMMIKSHQPYKVHSIYIFHPFIIIFKFFRGLLLLTSFSSLLWCLHSNFYCRKHDLLNPPKGEVKMILLCVLVVLSE